MVLFFLFLLLVIFGYILMLIVLWKDLFKSFCMVVIMFVFGMVFVNFFSGLSVGLFLLIEISFSYGVLDFLGKEMLFNVGFFLFYWIMSVLYLLMLGLLLC